MDIPTNPIWQQHLFLGAWQTGDGEQVNVREPATDEVISQLKTATPADVEPQPSPKQLRSVGWTFPLIKRRKSFAGPPPC